MREKSGTFLSQRLLPLTFTWTSGQGYQVVSGFQRTQAGGKEQSPGDQLVGPNFSLFSMDMLSGLSTKSLGTHLALEFQPFLVFITLAMPLASILLEMRLYPGSQSPWLEIR